MPTFNLDSFPISKALRACIDHPSELTDLHTRFKLVFKKTRGSGQKGLGQKKGRNEKKKVMTERGHKAQGSKYKGL